MYGPVIGMRRKPCRVEANGLVFWVKTDVQRTVRGDLCGRDPGLGGMSRKAINRCPFPGARVCASCALSRSQIA
jgi:hypothetical protein